jgi:hypothetical protein
MTAKNNVYTKLKDGQIDNTRTKILSLLRGSNQKAD